MRLRQTEYCHNCNEHVEFEFDDVEMRQVIICPNCGHEHYRELDQGTIVKIRASMGQRIMRIAKIPEPDVAFIGDSIPIGEPIVYEEKEILTDADGNKFIREDGGVPKISNRRWGQDPSQRG